MRQPERNLGLVHEQLDHGRIETSGLSSRRLGHEVALADGEVVLRRAQKEEKPAEEAVPVG
jgi:hypothetical protein